jgi:DNA gyrase inhibitor GyrI
VSVIEGIQECQRQFFLRKTQFLTCYGMALDDPLTIARERCRFDICVIAPSLIQCKGHWGQKKILAGKYVVFTHRGPFFELEEVFTRLFYLWHTSSKEKLRFSGAYCEYADLSLDTTISPSSEVTAKYYVPLLE